MHQIDLPNERIDNEVVLCAWCWGEYETGKRQGHAHNHLIKKMHRHWHKHCLVEFIRMQRYKRGELHEKKKQPLKISTQTFEVYKAIFVIQTVHKVNASRKRISALTGFTEYSLHHHVKTLVKLGICRPPKNANKRNARYTILKSHSEVEAMVK